jgi:hypothetical protein
VAPAWRVAPAPVPVPQDTYTFAADIACGCAPPLMASTDHPLCAHLRCCAEVEVRLQLSNPEAAFEQKKEGSAAISTQPRAKIL